MDKQQLKYKPNAASDDLPKNPEPPALKLCQLVDGSRLQIPTDVRTHFMQCPLFGPEWRGIVKQFDKDWGIAVATSTPAGENDAPGGSPAPLPSPVKKEEVKIKMKVDESAFKWETAFPGCPTTFSQLKGKFAEGELSEMVGMTPTSSFYLAPGPQLYVVAKEPLHLKALEGAVISHGAGSWLTGDKATKFVTNSPDRGVPCRLESDELPAVFEALACQRTSSKKTNWFLKFKKGCN